MTLVDSQYREAFIGNTPPMMPPLPIKQGPMGQEQFQPGMPPQAPMNNLSNRTGPPPVNMGPPGPPAMNMGPPGPPAMNMGPPGPPAMNMGPPGPPRPNMGGFPPRHGAPNIGPPGPMRPPPMEGMPPTVRPNAGTIPNSSVMPPPLSNQYPQPNMLNGVNSSPQQPTQPYNGPPGQAMRPPGPMHMTNGPMGQQGPSASGGFTPPLGGSAPPRLPGTPTHGVSANRPPTLPGINTPPPNSSSSSPGGILPVPYHGQAQYSHQLGVMQQNSLSLTPSNSEPASQKSSRAPSPISGTKFDALEGQFPSTPQSPQGPPLVMGQPTSPSASVASIAPPTSFPIAPSSSSQAPFNGQVNNMPAMQPPPPAMNQAGGAPPFPNQLGGAPPPMMGPPGMQPPPQPGMPPPNMRPQMGSPPTSYGQPGYPATTSVAQPPQMPAPPTSTAGIAGRRQYPNMPPQPVHMSSNSTGNIPNSAPVQSHAGLPNNTHNSTQPNLSSSFGKMSLQQQMEGRPLNLLQERNLIPPTGVPDPKPNLAHDYKKANCNPELFRCTLSTLPNSQSLVNKSKLPLGILIHPFKDLSQLPVIQSSVIVRCRSCRTYINPFVSFVDMRRWKCNLCYRVNELPDEFNYDPVSRTYGEPQRRPEIRSATIEFIAPSEYMLRPPQPAVYLYLLDVSFNAVSTGYLQIFCQTLMDELERIPGDARTQIGFITYDSSVHFYNLSEGLSQPQMLVVSDVDDIFLPSPDNLLVNLQESKELVIDLLTQLPSMFEKNVDTGSALGAALQAAFKMTSPTGGRVSVFQTLLPNVGPGSLKNREDPNERAGKNVQNMGPATDFYKKLSLECSGQQVAVDLFMLNSQYADIASVGCISKYSGGCVHYFPGLHANNQPESERFEGTIRRYLTRKIGFEAVMRIRCTRGLSIHTFHGNFFVRSTDLLSLPNINPDAGFGMQMSIEDTLDSNTACFQAALLYTSSKGERRIRVHTLCLPVTNQLTDVYNGADQKAIVGLLGKMAVDRSITSSMTDARDALINACIDMLSSYGSTLPAAQRMGQLACAFQTRLMPLYLLSMLKYRGYRVGSSTKLDDRVFALEQLKTQPLGHSLMELYPNMYPVHALDDNNALNKNDQVIPQPGLLHLSAANMDRHGAYILDTSTRIFLWVGAAVSDVFCQEVFQVPNFASIEDGMCELPDLENATSERLRIFIQYLQDQRPFPASLHVIREDSRNRGIFLQYLVEDRTEATMSYYEFLQHLQKEAK